MILQIDSIGKACFERNRRKTIYFQFISAKTTARRRPRSFLSVILPFLFWKLSVNVERLSAWYKHMGCTTNALDSSGPNPAPKRSILKL